MGFGFPPFRGGPFYFVDHIGAGTALERMNRLAEKYGDRFAPAAILRKHAETGRRFRLSSQ